MRTAIWSFICYIILFAFFFSPTTVPFDVNDNSKFIIANTVSDAAEASTITSIALADVKNLLRQSYDRAITQLEITNHIDYIMRAEGSDGVLSYPTVIMAQDEWTKPYGGSNDDANHIVDPMTEPVMVVKAGAKFNGQSCDVARTFLFDTATQEMTDAYSAVLDTEQQVIAAIVPGASISALSAIVEVGLSNYTNRTDVIYSYYWGHGLGAFTVEDPILSNDTEATTLLEGEVLSIQVYLYFDTGWLVRVEDTVAVTDTGVAVLSDAPKELSDIIISSNSTVVTSNIDVLNYEYGEMVSLNATINDTANRSIDSVSFFDGKTWHSMTGVEDGEFSLQYLLDYTYPSFIPGLVRVNLDGSVMYFDRELNADVEPSYVEIFDPPISIVVEQVTTDTMMSWAFTRVGAEMLRVHFHNVYPPPGDQFLMRDSEGMVVFEYKWNLGEEAMSPWVPGNTLYIDVVPQWQSIYGGVNHFYFTVDEMGVVDLEYTPTTHTTTTSETTSTTDSTSSTTGPTSITSPTKASMLIILSGVSCASIGLLVLLYLKKK
jgi:hypothetical protein